MNDVLTKIGRESVSKIEVFNTKMCSRTRTRIIFNWKWKKKSEWFGWFMDIENVPWKSDFGTIWRSICIHKIFFQYVDFGHLSSSRHFGCAHFQMKMKVPVAQDLKYRRPKFPLPYLGKGKIVLLSIHLSFKNWENKTIFARKYRIIGELRHEEILVVGIFFFFYLV